MGRAAEPEVRASCVRHIFEPNCTKFRGSLGQVDHEPFWPTSGLAQNEC